MAKISNPVTFSGHFGIDAGLLQKRGILNPTLNVDTRLFIDPLLLEDSSHPEMSASGRKSYTEHFRTVVNLLKVSKAVDDVPWRNAHRYLSFPEIKWTCLGYGAQSVSGSGSGPQMTGQILATAKEIVDLGIEDPDLFMAMALFEDGFGPDHISDMTAQVILDDLLKWNARVLQEISVPTEDVKLSLPGGERYEAALPVNPYDRRKAPVILVPTDILRDLPVATDWSDVADAAAKSAYFRGRVNVDIAKIWRRKTQKDKAKLKLWALSRKEAFQTLLEMIRKVEHSPYNVAGDPAGELFWRERLRTVAELEPFRLKAPPQLDLAGVNSIVNQIIKQFRFLIEERRFSEDLYNAGKLRPEKAAQRLFFAVAHSYCKANNLDLTPEADTGNGPVDFKVSSGFSGRVLVEIKLSTNPKLVAGYTRQLKTYETAEETQHGYYVVLDVGKMGQKGKMLRAAKNAAAGRAETTSPIVFIDASRRPSASKL